MSLRTRSFAEAWDVVDYGSGKVSFVAVAVFAAEKRSRDFRALVDEALAEAICDEQSTTKLLLNTEYTLCCAALQEEETKGRFLEVVFVVGGDDMKCCVKVWEKAVLGVLREAAKSKSVGISRPRIRSLKRIADAAL